MMKRIFYAIACAALLMAVLPSCDDSAELDYLTKEENPGAPGNGSKPDNPDDPDNPDNPDDPNVGGTHHALIFYFVGIDLDSYFGANLEAVKRAVDQNILGDNRIVCFRRIGGSGSSDWAISEIYYDRAKGCADSRVLKRYEAPDLSQMELFLSDMVGLVPAETYGLVLGGHGSGWLPKSIGSGWSTSYSAAGAKLHGNYENPFGEAPREDALPTRYFGERTVMFDLEDISAAMQAVGVEFEYMLFDDCFMSNIESLYALRDAADYIIASPCEIMAAGFPYKTVIPCIFADGGPDLKGVCRAFYDYYMYEYSYHSACVALTCCSQLEALAEAYAALVAGATNEVDQSTLQYYEGLARHLFYDFGQYAELLSADTWLYKRFEEQFDLAFPPECRFNTPSFYSAFGGRYMIDIDYYSGVTTSEPADRNIEANRATEWYRATHRTESDDESDKKIESNR